MDGVYRSNRLSNPPNFTQHHHHSTSNKDSGSLPQPMDLGAIQRPMLGFTTKDKEQDRRNGTCYQCHQTGHQARMCPKRQHGNLLTITRGQASTTELNTQKGRVGPARRPGLAIIQRLRASPEPYLYLSLPRDPRLRVHTSDAVDTASESTRDEDDSQRTGPAGCPIIIPEDSDIDSDSDCPEFNSTVRTLEKEFGYANDNCSNDNSSRDNGNQEPDPVAKVEVNNENKDPRAIQESHEDPIAILVSHRATPRN
ncbi:hypothetical protein B0O80DRAFT_431931 [Mortierella sp. GBAus27b]|nr:hypothetical protein B0O80DRAFT_431931 [Mortierella sp. GBAus27b]